MRIIPECGRVAVTQETAPFVFQLGHYAGAMKVVEQLVIPTEKTDIMFKNLYDNQLRQTSAELRKVIGTDKALTFQYKPSCEFVLFDCDPNKLTYGNNEVVKNGDKYELKVEEEKAPEGFSEERSINRIERYHKAISGATDTAKGVATKNEQLSAQVVEWQGLYGDQAILKQDLIDKVTKMQEVVNVAKGFIKQLDACLGNDGLCNINECYICDYDYEPKIEELRQALTTLGKEV
jgi:hypothetical protein